MPPHIAAQCRPPVSPLSRAASRTGQSIGIFGPWLVVGGSIFCGWHRRWRLRRRIVAQDVQRRGIQVVVLPAAHRPDERPDRHRSEEHTSELQSLMRISYAVFCLKKKNYKT